MTRTPWSRRSVLGALAAGVALPIAGCGGGHPAVAAPSPAPAARTVMVIRHAEKPDGSAAGVDPDGTADPEALTVAGWTRAGALVELFAPATGPVRTGLVRPTSLVASDRAAAAASDPSRRSRRSRPRWGSP